jgi:hypothetical protein
LSVSGWADMVDTLDPDRKNEYVRCSKGSAVSDWQFSNITTARKRV